MKRIAVSFAALILLPLVAAGQIIDFEDLPPGVEFTVGDYFTTGDVDVLVEPFIQSGSVWAYGHRVAILDASSNPMRTGNAAFTDPANLRFEFGHPLDGLSLRFAEYGPGGLNIEINGHFHEFDRMQDVHNTVVGGVLVTVTGGGYNRTGILELEPAGELIHAFTIGGFELFVDDVAPGALGAFEIYYSNFNDHTVYRHREGSGTFPLYSRPTPQPAHWLNHFEFAPWSPDQLYYVNSAHYDVYSVDLAGSPPTEALMHAHTVNGTSEQIRCIAFDSYGNLYLSDLDRLGPSLGRIWKLNTQGGSTTATLIWTVTSAETGWSTWNGHFAFGPNESIYISGGNLESSSIYRIDLAASALVEMFSHPAGSVCGMAFGPDGLLYYADPKAGAIYQLDLSDGTRTPVLMTGTNVSDVGLRELIPQQIPPLVPWVMLHGIGGIRVDQIKTAPATEGLIDYWDGISERTMKNAPFGGRLGIQINASNNVPTSGKDGVYYYRIQYKHRSWANWKEVTEPLYARYVSQFPGQLPTFPSLKLGPHSVAGKNVYRFLPHNSDLPTLVQAKANEMVSWPKKPFPGEEYEGFLDTVKLGLAPGVYDLRLEVYDELGNLTPGAKYDFLIPAGPSASISPSPIATDYSLPLHVDNRPCSAEIDPPVILGTPNITADICGFLRYQNLTDTVQLNWHALHPKQHAVYSFSVYRGAMSILGFSDDVSSSAHNGDTLGNFREEDTVSNLLNKGLPPSTSCGEGAFGARLYVLAKATTGNGYRINKYDAQDNFAFALAPK